MKAIACTPPQQLRLPLARLQIPDIRAEAIRQGIVAEISGTTIWRWLAEDALRPWAHRSWIFPRDPDFARKAGVVLDLYARRYQGRPLGLGEYEQRILDYQARYEESARPFEWRFTRRDLTALLRRIAEHERLPAAA